MEMKKIKANWVKPLTPLVIMNIDGIALHHSEHRTAGAEEINTWHKGNGWSGIGYNYFIDKQGNIIECRGFQTGAHTANNNSHLIGICFQGDFESYDMEMPDEQFNAGVELIKLLKYQVPTIKIIDGHRHWRPTVCPGKYFPLAEIKALKTRSDRMAISIAKQRALAELLYLQEKGRINGADQWHNNIIANTTPNLEYLIMGYAKEVRKNESGNA